MVCPQLFYILCTFSSFFLVYFLILLNKAFVVELLYPAVVRFCHAVCLYLFIHLSVKSLLMQSSLYLCNIVLCSVLCNIYLDFNNHNLSLGVTFYYISACINNKTGWPHLDQLCFYGGLPKSINSFSTLSIG